MSIAKNFKVKNGIDAGGIITAPSFVGDGSSVTNITATNITTGILPVVRGGTGSSTATGSGTTVLSVSPTFTGTPLTTTAVQDTNTTQIASTAFVVGQASGSLPLMNSTATVGTSLRYARADHIHGSDTAKVDKTTTVNGHALSGNVSVSKSDVGLGNVDNTSDVNKPISTATQSALDLKASLASPTFTGTVSGISKSMVGLGNVTNDPQVTSVSGTSPIISSGGTTPAISIQAATASQNGYMSSTYASKLDGIATNANNYSLPNATASVLGGVKTYISGNTLYINF